MQKLQRAADGVPTGEQTPELKALLGFATAMEAAEEQLKDVAACKQAGSQEPQELEPELFQARVAGDKVALLAQLGRRGRSASWGGGGLARATPPRHRRRQRLAQQDAPPVV